MSSLFPCGPIIISNEDHRQLTSVLLIGAKQTCKTSLLFQWAITLAQQTNDEIVFISPNIINKKPIEVHGMPKPTSSLLELIKITYISTYDDMVNYLSDFHQSKTFPAAFVIDDFNILVNRRSEKQQIGNAVINVSNLQREQDEKIHMSKLSALLIDTANFCLKKTNKAFSVIAVYNTEMISSTTLMEETLLLAQSVGKRFFNQVWVIEKAENFLRKQYYFRLKVPKDEFSFFNIYYYFDDKHVILDKVTLC